MSLIAAVNKHIRASSGMENDLLPFKDTVKGSSKPGQGRLNGFWLDIWLI